MTVPIKTPTAWRPVSGQGNVILVGNLPIVHSATKLPIVDNAIHLPIVTTSTITTPKTPATWTAVG